MESAHAATLAVELETTRLEVQESERQVSYRLGRSWTCASTILTHLLTYSLTNMLTQFRCFELEYLLAYRLTNFLLVHLLTSLLARQVASPSLCLLPRRLFF